MKSPVSLGWSIKLIAAVALLGWLVARTDVRQIAHLLSTMSPIVLVALIAMVVLTIVVMSIRWQLLLPEKSLWLLFRFTMMAQFYALVVPSGLGAEAVKAYVLGRGGGDAERIAASVALDKITNLISILLLGLGGAAFTSLSIGSEVRSSLIGMTAACIGILFVFRLRAFHTLANGTISWIGRRISRAGRMMDQLALVVDASQSYLEHPLRLVGSIIIGLVQQAIIIGTFVLLGKEFGVSLPIHEWCWIAAAVSIAVIMPVSVAGVGVRDGLLVGIFSAFGYSAESALAVSFSLLGLHLLMGVAGLFIQLRWKSTGQIER